MKKFEEKDVEKKSSFASAIPPADTFNFAYLVHFVLGAGILLPWNAFIAAVDYFNYLYPDVHIDRVFSVAYMLPSFVFLIFLMDFGRAYRMRTRINCGLTLYVVTILVVPLMDETLLKGRQGTQFSLFVTVGAVVLTGIADALAQGSLVGAAGELPERYMQAVFAGTAASGVLVSLLRIVTKATLPGTVAGLRMSSNVYFGVSGAFVVLCIILNNLVDRLPVVSYYHRQKFKSLKILPLLSGEEKLGTECNLYDTDKAAIRDLPLQQSIHLASYLHVFKQIQGLAIALASIYVVTLSIFPGFITEDVHSTVLHDWYPILLIAVYNFSDLFGKILTAFYCIESRWLMIGGCIARVLFYPLFAGCLHGPNLLRTETPVFILTFLLGASNGYLTSSIMMFAPKAVCLQEAETAGIILVIFLVTGLATGSCLGWLWVI